MSKFNSLAFKILPHISFYRLRNFKPEISIYLIIIGSEYEQNQVTEATKLGGMRLKQSDLVLKDFGTAAENLQE